MSYHNVRDSYGRFSKGASKAKPRGRKTRKRAKVKERQYIFDVFNLDYSISMRDKVAATVSGFNEVLDGARASSKKEGINTWEALVKFGDAGRESWQIGETPKLSTGYQIGTTVYAPTHSSTALWDAVAYGIEKIDEALRTMPKGTKLVYTIFTDGEENSSRRFKEWEVRDMIQKRQAAGWVINFVGAGTKKEVETVAAGMGIFLSNTVNYANTSAGTSKAFATVSRARSSFSSKVAQNIATQDGFFSED